MMAGSGTTSSEVSAQPASPSRREFLRGRRHTDKSGAGTALPLRAVIGEACLALRGVECRICGDACGAGAIRFRPVRGGVALPIVAEDACTACGDCVAPCPTGAIPAMQP